MFSSMRGKDDGKWEAMNREVISRLDAGQTGQALTLARELFDYSRKAYGRKHKRTANALNNLGFILMMEGKLDEAESSLLAGLELGEKVYGKSSREVGFVNANLSMLYMRKSGEIKNAREAKG